MTLGTFFDNFELLADAPNAVEKMRELILKLAVQGKLVIQNSADGQPGPELSKCGIDLKRWAVTDKAGATFSDDRVAQGHLFANIDEYDAFIKRHVPVISELSAAKDAREDVPVFPYWPLREGFRNALMHRDYNSYHGRVTVSVHARRIEIWSFGMLPQGLTIDSLKKEDRSLPVNPDIAQVVFLRGLVELLGRGTRKIVEEFRSFGLPEPVWREQAGGIALTMRGGHAPGELPGELNARQIDLLPRIRPGMSVNLNAVRRTGAEGPSERTARNDLAGLVKLGFLVRQGRGKSIFYVRTEKPMA